MFHNLEHYEDHRWLYKRVLSHFSNKIAICFFNFFEKLQILTNAFKINPTALGPLPFDGPHQNLSFGIVLTPGDALGPKL